MSDAELASRFHAAHAIARACGELAMRHFTDRSGLAITMKGDQDWLTIADGAVETLFRKLIAEAFPNDAVMGEEQGGETSGRLWIIDPIDGTANFARGDRNWCVSIGYLHDGRPEIGVIAAPALDETYLARRGRGATLNGAPIRAAATSDFRLATVECGWSTRRPLQDYLDMVARCFRGGAAVKRSASGAMGLAHVANGRTDAYAELHINAWDVAAGVVIATEAGALVNDFFAGEWARHGNPILAVAPGLARTMAKMTGIGLN
jgi:myo-inositol-1(or 4)-monophosphatase